jgi:hypothetical protein
MATDTVETVEAEAAPAPAPEVQATEGAIAAPRKAQLVTHESHPGFIAPTTIEEAHRFAVAVMKAGLAPPSYSTVEQVMMGVMKALEVGLPPLTGLASIMIVNNRATVWGDGAMALVHRSGKLRSIEIRKVGVQPKEGASLMAWPDSFGYSVTAFRVGHHLPYTGQFTVGDAKRAGLWLNPKKDPWMKYPDRMLMIRARSIVIRDGFADCLAGLQIAEEVMDYEAGERNRIVDSSALFDDAEDDAVPE